MEREFKRVFEAVRADYNEVCRQCEDIKRALDNEDSQLRETRATVGLHGI